MIRRALRNSSWLMIEKVITMGASLLVTLVLARQLGPEGFGVLNYLLAIVAIVSPLAALGLNALVSRELVEKHEQEQKIIATATVLRLIGAGGGALCLLVLAFSGVGLAGEGQQVALVLLAVASVFNAFQVMEYWFESQLKSAYVSSIRAAIMLVFAGIKIGVAWYYVDLVVLAAVYAMEVVCLGIGYGWIYQRMSMPVRWKSFDPGYGIGLIRESSWLIFSSVAAILYLKIDQVMIPQLSSQAELGVYAAAVRLSEVWYFFANAFVVSFFPMLLILRRQNDQASYMLRMQYLCDGLFGLAFVLAIVVSIFATPVILFLFGPAYDKTVTILVIHIWAGVFVFMRALASKWLMAERLLMFSLVSHGLGLLVNIGLNFMLIPTMGGAGAAVATVVSYAVASYVAFWVAPSTRPMAMIMTHSLLLPVTLGYRYWKFFPKQGGKG